jgi:hypothetical protein
MRSIDALLFPGSRAFRTGQLKVATRLTGSP